MNRSDVDWWGYWVAAPTPFTGDGAVDEPAFRKTLAAYVSCGVHGVLVNGSTGEWFSQSAAERRFVAEIAVDEIQGAVPVLVGVSSYTAAEAAGLARHAASIGADGALATAPPYVHPSPDEIVAFFRAVTGATSLPFMVYNWPRGVAVDLGAHPGLLRRLADLDQVVAMKDSTGDWLGLLASVEGLAADTRVFGSFIHRRGLAVLAGLGGDGNIDGGGVAAPFAVAFYEAVRAGDHDGARRWADRYTSISGALIRPDYSGIYASPIPQLKAAMRLLGQPGGTVREPLLELTDPVAVDAIAGILREAGLAEAWQAVRS